MKKIVFGSLIVAGMALSTACGGETTGEFPLGPSERPAIGAPAQDWADWGDSWGDTVNIGEVRMVGDVGPVANIDAVTNNVNAYSSNDWTTITATANTPNGSAMTIVDIGVDLDTLQPGVYTEREIGYLAIIGCSGPSEGAWDFDEPARDVVIEVEEETDPETDEPTGVMVVHATAEFAPVGRAGVFGGDGPTPSIVTTTFVVDQPTIR